MGYADLSDEERERIRQLGYESEAKEEIPQSELIDRLIKMGLLQKSFSENAAPRQTVNGSEDSNGDPDKGFFFVGIPFQIAGIPGKLTATDKQFMWASEDNRFEFSACCVQHWLMHFREVQSGFEALNGGKDPDVPF